MNYIVVVFIITTITSSWSWSSG